MHARANNSGLTIGGYRAITKYVDYHSARRSTDVVAEIVSHLDKGRIVILDLSAGPVVIRSVLSKRIAQHIFDRQMNALNSGESPKNLVSASRKPTT